MTLLFQCGLYSALLCLAVGLQCYHYNGLPDHALQKQVAKPCGAPHTYCSTTLLKYRELLNIDTIIKGCSAEDSCNHNKTYSMTNTQITQTILCCDSELCNSHLVPELGDDYRTECFACQGPPTACAGNDLPSLRCGPSQKNCVEVSITMALSQDTQHTMIKSCSNLTCPGPAAFSNGEHPVSYSSNHLCCNGSHCNSGHFIDVNPGAENGLECYSRSSTKGVSKMQCRGLMTQCMDLIGSSRDDVVMSGCATEAFCQGGYPQFDIPGWKSTACCSQSFCNHGDSATDLGAQKHP
ncbi:urokinase plasminogen activator surface receptor-like [Pseudophryne corroboree]|uniref:urokinase plasminogen activator surface receptor-like n=1 Tax=Pseudophryne corroboree TaxID=495146 RepID=UPI003081BADD